MQQEVKYDMQQNISLNNYGDEQISILQIEKNAQEITFKDNGKEIVYNNDLYDVISYEFVNGIYTIKCIKDIKESSLITALKKNIENRCNSSGQNKNDTSQKSPTKDFFSSNKLQLYFSPNKYIATQSIFASIPTSYFLFDVPSPPPKTA